MATIYTRKDDSGSDRYYINLTIDGKRLRRFAGYTKKVAQDKLKQIEYELTFKPKRIHNSKTLVSSIKSYMSYIQTTNIKEKQVGTINRHVNWFKKYCDSLGIECLNDVQNEHARDYINKRASTTVQSKYKSAEEGLVNTLSASSIMKEISFIKRYFNYCVDMEWINKNPFRNVKAPKKRGSNDRYYFKQNDIQLIMANAGKFYDFYYLLLHTGIRSTDAFKLKPKHFEDGYLRLKMNKTGDFLHIPIPIHVLDKLRPLMSDSLLFEFLKSDRQRRNCVKNVQRLFEPQFVRDNNINLHTFRHTYAHTMLNKGVPKEVLQTLLGHRSIRTTEIYANWVRKEELEKWV